MSASAPALRAAGAAGMLVGAGAAFAELGSVALPLDLWHALLAGVIGATALALSELTVTQSAGGGWYGGVAVRLARPRAPAWSIRVLVLALAPLAGLGVAAYAAAALILTLSSAPARPAHIGALRTTGTGFLGLAAVLAARAGGLLVGGKELPWAALLIGSGLSLFWSAAGARRDEGAPLLDALELRTALGLLLALGGAVWVLSRAGLFHQAGGTILGSAAALAVLALVVGPRWLRTARALGAERTDQARAQERAELADHLHDSVLQTLALIQRRAGDALTVRALARRQERELRDWLLEEIGAGGAEGFLGAALRATAAEIEDLYGVRIELVSVGDVALDERTRALVRATREALSNAARHAQGSPISLFAKVADGFVEIYVHDRGPGFDPARVPAERRGVRESIIARVERHGGTAIVDSAAGNGCEIRLRLALR